MLSKICLHVNQKAHVACNFNYRFKNEALLKITASHVNCKSYTYKNQSFCLFICSLCTASYEWTWTKFGMQHPYTLRMARGWLASITRACRLALCALSTRFPISFDIVIQGLFKDFQGTSNFIFKDQFSTEVYSMSSRTAIFNVYLCDDGTVIR